MRYTLLILSLLILTACNESQEIPADNTDPTDNTPTETTPTETPPTETTVDFESIQNNVFDKYCTRCHSGFNAPLGLRLDEAYSYNNLYMATASQNSNFFRVNPGDPNSSYLIRKLEGNAGTRMPLGEAKLPQSTIDEIRQWITDGALNTQPSSKTSAALSFTFKSIWPADNTVLNNSPESIYISFSREIDSSYLYNLSLILIDDEENRKALDLHLSLDNPNTVLADLSEVRLSSGNYQIKLEMDINNPIRDLEGNVLKLADGITVIESNFRIE